MKWMVIALIFSIMLGATGIAIQEIRHVKHLRVVAGRCVAMIEECEKSLEKMTERWENK